MQLSGVEILLLPFDALVKQKNTKNNFRLTLGAADLQARSVGMGMEQRVNYCYRRERLIADSVQWAFTERKLIFKNLVKRALKELALIVRAHREECAFAPRPFHSNVCLISYFNRILASAQMGLLNSHQEANSPELLPQLILNQVVTCSPRKRLNFISSFYKKQI